MLISLLFALLAWHSPSGAPPEFRDPVDFTSPSGNHRLHVTAETRSGEQAAYYEMFAGEDMLWSQRLEFALEDAAVSDQGVVVGHARFDSPDSQDRDALVVAVLDPLGKVVFEERTPLYRTRAFNNIVQPTAWGLLVDFEHDRFHVRVNDPGKGRKPQLFWSYRISKPERLGAFEVGTLLKGAEGRARTLLEHQVVPGVGLILLYYRSTKQTEDVNETGASFVLVDEQGAIKWRLDLPDDYNPGENFRERYRIYPRLRKLGVIKQTGVAGQFELLHWMSRERVAFQVIRDDEDPDEWVVRETGRRVLEEAVSEAGKALTIPMPEVELDLLEEIQMEHVQPEPFSPFGVLGLDSPIDTWTLAEDGGFLLLHEDEEIEGAVFQVRLSKSGEFRERLEFAPFPPDYETTGALALGGDEWLITSTYWSQANLQMWALLDGQTGQVQTLPLLAQLEKGGKPFMTSSARRMDNGDLVIVGTNKGDESCLVVRLSKTGALIWASTGSAAALGHNSLVAVTPEGQVLVMDSRSGHLLTLDGSGKLIRSLDLSSVLKRDSLRMTAMGLSASGRLLLGDGKTFWTMSTLGEQVRSLNPHYPEPSAVEPYSFDDAHIDQAGHVWITHENSFLQLDDKGLVAKVLQAPSTPGVLYLPNNEVILPGGLIGIRDQHNGNLHVWNDRGERLLIGKLLPGESDNWTSFFPNPVLGAHGEFWVPIGNGDFTGWDSKGKRLGPRFFGGDLAFVPGSERYWTEPYRDGAKLHAANGDVLAHVERLTDGRWIGNIVGINFGPNGEVYLLDGGSGTVLEYTAEGVPVGASAQTLDAHRGSGLFVPGQWRVPKQDDAIIVRPGRGDQPDQWLELTGPIIERCWIFGISSDGECLISVDIETLTLFTQALPK